MKNLQYISLTIPVLLVVYLYLFTTCNPSQPATTPGYRMLDPSVLSLEELYLPLGETGLVVKVESTQTDLRLPLPDGPNMVLPETIRLFRLDKNEGKWTLVPASKYHAGSEEVVVPELGKGLYIAAGWSANPAENVLQRLIYDWGQGVSPKIPESVAANLGLTSR
ncbi:hypothetical protein AB9P05_23780 [Roseivirga sp. BDSF3-8]|uniref:hypothetical protein n=1 Tax=Roseivirga sp. BDSF3-8 TaxID=3241598 RepID=UPI0035326E50